MRHLLSLFLLNFVFISFSISLNADELSSVPNSYRILTFPTANPMQAIETLLDPTPSGRLKTRMVGATVNGGDCEAHLTSFQSRPLEKMVERGYITARMRDDLMNLTALGLKLEQLVLISQFSEMPKSQALKIFNGQLPGDRSSSSLGAQGDSSELVRIDRGTIFMVRGYEPVLDERKKMKLKPLLLPWEIGLPGGAVSNPVDQNKLTRAFDRQRVTAMVEIGRAYMESGVLPGNLTQAVHVLLTYLGTEARALKIDPKHLILTAHFLDPQHTRLFSHLFPLRVLTPEVQREVELNIDAGIANAFAKPLPTGKAWQQYDDAVTISTMALGQERFPIEAISENASAAGTAAQGRMAPETVLDFFRDLTPRARESFTYIDPEFTPSPYPVVLRDLGTPLMLGNLFRSLKAKGIFQDIGSFVRWIEPLDVTLHEPDVNLDQWIDHQLMLPFDEAASRASGEPEAMQTFVINNLDYKLAEQYPVKYLSAVLLSVADLLQQRIDNMNPETYSATLAALNEVRKHKGKPALNSFDFAKMIDLFPIVVSSSSAAVNAQAPRIGGRTVRGISLEFKMETKDEIKFAMDVKHPNMYSFDFHAISELRKHFPASAANARSRLQPGLWAPKLQMTMSGAF